MGLFMRNLFAYSTLVSCLLIIGCVGPTHGPDKQFEGLATGAATGAGAGAITGAQLGAATTGPGALVGAGLGAAVGAIQGYVQDQHEESLLRLSADSRLEREISFAHEALNEHYKRRAELHPTRDIFPSDLFFRGDEVNVRRSAKPIIRELAKLNKDRTSWSRFVITSYVKSSDEESSYAHHLAESRAKNLGDLFVRYGIEPRRIVARGVLMSEAILHDPDDRKSRYNQAIELAPVDR